MSDDLADLRHCPSLTTWSRVVEQIAEDPAQASLAGELVEPKTRSRSSRICPSTCSLAGRVVVVFVFAILHHSVPGQPVDDVPRRHLLLGQGQVAEPLGPEDANNRCDVLESLKYPRSRSHVSPCSRKMSPFEGATNAVDHNEPAHPRSQATSADAERVRAWLSAKLVAGVFTCCRRCRAASALRRSARASATSSPSGP
jgi:hypothetical protein